MSPTESTNHTGLICKSLKPLTGEKISGAQLIAETFKGYGITHVFFVESILRKALAAMEALGIRRILTHSEKAAAYMADGYARFKRAPGICMAQSVGAANLAAGLQDAFLGLSPVIAVTGRKDPLYQHRNAYQELAHGDMFIPVTKFRARVDAPEQLAQLLRQAFRESTSGAPGPVHLDLLGFVGQITANYEFEDIELIVEKPFTRFPSQRPVPEEKCLQAAAAALGMAERPVIVAGGGAMASSAGDEITDLAEKLSIPVATSLNGKGIIPDNHPLAVGVVGSYARSCANKIVSQADLVLFIGSQTGDMVTDDWTLPRPGTAVIQIDIDPLELGRSYPNLVGLMGDARATVRRLSNYVDASTTKDRWATSAREIVQQWQRAGATLSRSDDVPIRPERLCRQLTKVLPPDAVLVVDTGYSSAWTGALVDLNHRGQRYIRAAGSLGWAFPASLGAKCAAPDRPVVCFTGDGGFWYHLCELETAKRYGIHTVTVVNNNSCLAQSMPGVERDYDGMPGNKNELFRFGKMDFARIAQDMGCVGIRVERPDQIETSLNRALET
ncbi:MAG: thiamine pyrophosphate-binding protein, partial [Desulfobacterales bacterium]